MSWTKAPKRGARAPREDELAAVRRRLAELQSLFAQTERAHEELTQFFEQSFDLHCVAGVDGYFKRLNPPWVDVLGWSLAELIGRPFLDFVHLEDRGPTADEVARLAAGAESISFRNRYRHLDGSYRWLEWNARSVVSRREIYATARDITKRMRLKGEILEIADREKERLGRELHDGLCQALAGIAALSSTLHRRLKRLNPAAFTTDARSALADASAEITRLLEEAVSEARELARGLHTVRVGERGLDGALESLARNVDRIFRASCTFACDEPFPRLSPEVEANAYRIAQEAVNNALVHGRAKRIEIKLASEDGKGHLSIRDDGVGITQETIDRLGLGLRTISYRAKLMGASLDVRRRARQGTTVICAFPLTEGPGAAADESDGGESD